MARGTDLDERRRNLIRDHGLDAYDHSAEEWLRRAVLSERLGRKDTLKALEEAMEIALERFGA
jgi:hypothetical protein